MSVDEVFDAVNKSFKRITLTGGEPLLHDEAVELCERLAAAGCEVKGSIEEAKDKIKKYIIEEVI